MHFPSITMSKIQNVGERILVKCYCLNDDPVHKYTIIRRSSHKQYFNQIWNSIKIWNALVQNVQNRSWPNFAHMTTALLSQQEQHYVVIGRICHEQEHCKIPLNLEFDLNIVSGTCARPQWVNTIQHHEHSITPPAAQQRQIQNVSCEIAKGYPYLTLTDELWRGYH